MQLKHSVLLMKFLFLALCSVCHVTIWRGEKAQIFQTKKSLSIIAMNVLAALKEIYLWIIGYVSIIACILAAISTFERLQWDRTAAFFVLMLRGFTYPLQVFAYLAKSPAPLRRYKRLIGRPLAPDTSPKV